MPTTFSPMTMGKPHRAAPTAKESQYLAAMKVEPRAPVMMGRRQVVLTSRPKRVATSTLGKMRSSLAVDSRSVRPWAPYA